MKGKKFDVFMILSSTDKNGLHYADAENFLKTNSLKKACEQFRYDLAIWTEAYELSGHKQKVYEKVKELRTKILQIETKLILKRKTKCI